MNKNLILTLIAAAALSAAPQSTQQLQAMARSANSPTKHAEVARAYTDRAAELDAEALRHEAEAQRLLKDNGYFPMRHKWPALANAPAETKRRLAMQARRAAHEARELARKHQGLAESKSVAAE